MRPLEGRRIWFVGIGGAGLSGYAVLARAHGAEVGGWDRVETPYLDHVRGAGIDPTIAAEPVVPPGWEVVVSTAFAERVEGRTRAEFLAELVELQPAIVVAGAHGKTTTAAMIAFVLHELGADPAFVIGGEIPQLDRANARAGTGWLIVEGDESDRTIAALRPKIAVVTNIDLDHHATFASRAEVEDLFAAWLAEVPHVVRGDELEPLELDELAVPGEHNRRNGAAALAALELAGIRRDDAAPALARFQGVTRRLELCAELGSPGSPHERILVYDDYAHHPAEIEATLAAARDAHDGAGRLIVLFQPHLYSRTRHLAYELAGALAAADVVVVTDVYPAREQPIEGVSGKLIVDELTQARPGMTIGWTPRVEDGARFISRRVRPGDTVLTIGAGDVDRAAALIAERNP